MIWVGATISSNKTIMWLCVAVVVISAAAGSLIVYKSDNSVADSSQITPGEDNGDYEVEVDGTYYKTIDEALDALNGQFAHIEILKDCTIHNPRLITANTHWTIGLNGHTVTRNGTFFELSPVADNVLLSVVGGGKIVTNTFLYQNYFSSVGNPDISLMMTDVTIECTYGIHVQNVHEIILMFVTVKCTNSFILCEGSGIWMFKAYGLNLTITGDDDHSALLLITREESIILGSEIINPHGPALELQGGCVHVATSKFCSGAYSRTYSFDGLTVSVSSPVIIGNRASAASGGWFVHFDIDNASNIQLINGAKGNLLFVFTVKGPEQRLEVRVPDLGDRYDYYIEPGAADISLNDKYFKYA